MKSNHGIENAWQWVAIVLNQKPTKIVPHILLTFIEVAGSTFLETYGKQALKIISFIRNTYIHMFPQECAQIAHKIRSFFSDNLDKNGKIPPLSIISRS